jgi:HlyD family secretion protein/macrolide-specific efflux system membrane fusion protein
VRRLIWFVLVPGLAIAGLVAVRQGRGGAAAELNKSLSAVVKRADLDVVVLETGRVEPRLQTQIKSKVGGQVVDVKVEEGQKVKAGQVLLRIDPADYRRDVERMEAESLQQREVVGYTQLQLDRTEKAGAGAIAAATEVDQARHEAALARARLKSAQVALETARDRLRYAEVEAPFDGTIIQRAIQPGEVVVPGVTATVEGKALLVLADISVLLVKIDLNQIDVARVQRGQKAEITLDALPGKTFSAVVTRVAPAAAVRASGGQGHAPDVFPVEASLDTHQDLAAIKPGMTADVRILVDKKQKVLVLPIESVITEKGKNFVQAIEGGKDGKPTTTRREITVGARSDRDVEVKSGLSEGARVLIKPPPADEHKF